MIHLDTNIVIAFMNGNKSIKEAIKQNIDEIALSAFVVAELDYGAKASVNRTRNLERLYRFIDLVTIVPFDGESARIFGTVKSELRKIGKPTGEIDAMIASVAMAQDAVLVTSNIKHFENIPGLKLEVWENV